MARNTRAAQPQAPSDTEERDVPRTGTGPAAPVTPRGEATRRRILDAAEHVFGEMGYYEASVSDIARSAGVAQGTFYIYFRSKRDIFIELVEDMGHRVRTAMSEAIVDTPDRLEAERRGFAAFFTFVTEHRRIYRIVQEAERVAPEVARTYYERISAGYVRGLKSAMESGTVREVDPEAISYALMGIGHFLALRWLIWPQDRGEADGAPHIPTCIFESMMEFITHGLSPDQHAS